MQLQNDEEFLKYIAKNYPDVDWDNLPDNPKIFVIEGKRSEKRIFKDYGKEMITTTHFVVGVEYATRELAEAQLKSMHETWAETQTYEHEYYTDIETVMPESWHIVEKYSIKDSELDMLALFKEKIDAGEKLFPIYLP